MKLESLTRFFSQNKCGPAAAETEERETAEPFPWKNRSRDSSYMN